MGQGSRRPTPSRWCRCDARPLGRCPRRPTSQVHGDGRSRERLSPHRPHPCLQGKVRRPQGRGWLRGGRDDGRGVCGQRSPEVHSYPPVRHLEGLLPFMARGQVRRRSEQGPVLGRTVSRPAEYAPRHEGAGTAYRGSASEDGGFDCTGAESFHPTIPARLGSDQDHRHHRQRGRNSPKRRHGGQCPLSGAVPTLTSAFGRLGSTLRPYMG